MDEKINNEIREALSIMKGNINKIENLLPTEEENSEEETEEKNPESATKDIGKKNEPMGED